MERVLVVGGAGYIGSNLCYQLNSLDFDFAILDDFKNAYKSNVSRLKKAINKDFLCFEGSANDREFLERAFCEYKPTIVVHLGNKKYIPDSIQNSLEYYENNLISTINVLALCSKHNIKKLLFSSTIVVYDDSEDYITEDYKRKFSSPYAKSKIMCEEIITDWQTNNQDKCAIIVRFTNPVGANSAAGLGDRPKSNNKNVLPYLVGAITSGEDIVINGGDYPTKDGSAVRDFIHVSDLTYLTVKLLQEIKDAGLHLYNIGSGTDGNSIKDIITTTAEIIGKDIPYTFNPTKDSRAAKILISSAKLNNVVKIELKHSLKDIILSQINLQQEGDDDEE